MQAYVTVPERDAAAKNLAIGLLLEEAAKRGKSVAIFRPSGRPASQMDLAAERERYVHDAAFREKVNTIVREAKKALPDE